MRAGLSDAHYDLSDLDAVVATTRPPTVQAAVRGVYREHAGHFLWSDGGRLRDDTHFLLRLVSELEDHGLDPAYVDGPNLQRLAGLLDWNLSLIERLPSDSPSLPSLFRLRALALGELDAQLTAAALVLARQLGRVTAGGAELSGVIPADPEERALWVRALVPWHPQYRRLCQALRRYRRYRKDGGFPEIRLPAGTRRLGPGDSGDAVAALRERLRAEGFATGPLPDAPERWDAILADAVKAFQQTRGLAATGGVDGDTLEALAVPVTHLERRIRSALRYWRHSKTRSERSFVQVNLPEYAVELYRSRRRVRRHRAVIGYAFGEGGGRTKRFHSEIEEVVLNPGWTPSDGILADELLPKERAQPGFLARQGFEWFTRPDGRRGVYQLPGGKNALGRVVIRFPNENNIYVHGSPDPEVFDQVMRAQSHGCIRVDHAARLAADLLLADGSTAPGEVQALLELGRTRTFTLKTKVPIHVEYALTVVDDDGAVRFLPNVYRL